MSTNATKAPKAPRSKGERSFKISKSSAPKKRKTGTVTTKKHRFESFSQRITKINIDPIRRVQGRAHVHQQDEASHFQVAFAEWKELNLSESFTSFARRVEPLCHNLPQILLYQDRIMELLVEYINKHENISLEPLLSLVAHFAHDLGVRFEQHFQLAVSTVSQLAAKHADVEVIEWSFTCLAWLFKYLSRLLVPDLRPTYDLMVPLLGKEHQKGFIMRFAAEAMSFLVRKAAAAYPKNQTPLDTILQHAFQDLAGTPPEQMQQYQEGLIVLFAESIKGVQRGVNTHARHIVKALLSHLYSQRLEAEQDTLMLETVRYILIDVIHNSDSDGFSPVVEAVLETSPSSITTPTTLKDVSSILFVLAGTRKGTRIQNWQGLITLASAYLKAVTDQAGLREHEAMIEVLKAVAVILQYAPLDTVLPFSQQILRTLDAQHWDPHFLGFCIFVADMGTERFENLVLSGLQRFVASRWEKYEEQLCNLLPRFACISYTTITKLRIPGNGQAKLEDTFKKLSKVNQGSDRHVSEHLLALCNRYIDVLESLTCEPAFLERIAALLKEALKVLSLGDQSQADSRLSAFLLSKGLLFMAKHVNDDDFDQSMLSYVVSVAKDQHCRFDYLRGLAQLIERKLLDVNTKTSGLETLMECLITNLASPSHDIRLSSLHVLLCHALETPSDHTHLEALEVALQIEQSSFNLDSARSIALNVRRLASLYVESVSKDEHLRKALPAYCYGLLHVRLTSAWDDASNALEAMSKAEGMEDIVIQRALDWLQPHEQVDTEFDDKEPEPEASLVTKSYQCSNIMKLEQIAGMELVQATSSSQQLVARLENDLAPQPLRSADDRAQALRVLTKMPLLAERRSRTLVPVLLRWALGDDHSEVDVDENTSATSQRWNRKDQKGLLNLFSLFVNPTVLYRSNHVYQALLGLLSNGDVEIQKSALKALFAWRSPSIRPYEENLMNLLDDARFRDEITVFLSISEEDSKIRLEHKAGLMPVLLNMLYGRIVTRAGSANRGTQQSKRRAVLLALARFGEDNLSQFMHIALGRLDNMEIRQGMDIEKLVGDVGIVSVRKQLGMLNMLDDTLDTLGDVVAPFSDRIISAILYCTIRSLSKLQASDPSAELEDASLLKSVRQSGYSCLTSLLTACPKVSWNNYLPVIIQELISPRLEKLPIETAQGVSAVLKLVATLSENSRTIDCLVDFDREVLENVGSCILVPSAKEEVKVFVLNNIISKVLEQAQQAAAADRLSSLVKHLKAHLGNTLADQVASLLKVSSEKNTLENGIRTLGSLTPYTNDGANTDALIKSCLRLLGLPTRLINPRMKGDVLTLLEHFIPLYDFAQDEAAYAEAVRTISSLFSFFQDSLNRLKLAAVFQKLCINDRELQEASQLCEALNAFSGTRLDEPDFEKRLQAFTTINDVKFDTFTAQQWQPIIHNMLFHVKDNEELSTRTSASLTIRKFVQKTCSAENIPAAQTALLADAVLPALQTGMREDSELIRAEYVSILAEVVRSGWPTMQDLRPLLGADEESSVFNNILHIQQHRRVRALRRSAEAAPSINSTNAARFCIPLIENFYLGGEALDNNLAIEAINTLDALAGTLEWQKYRALLQRMVGEAAKFDSKVKIRALGGVVNALYTASKSKSASATNMDVDGEQDQAELTGSQLARTLPAHGPLLNSLSKSVLAKLTEQVHFKDESTVDLRILVAISAVKIIMCFSPDDIDLHLPPLLLDICNILKSRSQEARDATRKTLADVSSIIGSRYFGFMIKQLRSALRSGPQRHVLSYTVHSILVSATPSLTPGEIDYCLPDVVEIIIEDIFGMVAQEKEAQEYLSKMKEVKKKSLGYDSMEILGSIVTLPHVTDLLQLIQDQLTKPRPKLDKIDELLRRLREGLRRNETAKSRDFLKLCYELLSGAYKSSSGSAVGTEPVVFKTASFALELLRRVLDKYEDLKTANNLSGFFPLLQQSMSTGVEEVEIASMRLFTSIIKVPLPDLDKTAKQYVRLAKRLIESASSTSTPVSQAALRLVSAILRERPNADIPKHDWDTSIAFILHRIKPDLQEPAKQGDRDLQVAAFNFLRAVVNRNEQIAEVYGVMDVVREVMITSGEPPIPDLARSVYTRFVLEYFPEELKGFAKQLDFLVANLQYPSWKGRLSVMEVVMFVLDRKADAAVQSLLVTFFLPLILVLATDEIEQCRDSAALLLRKMFKRADKERTKTFRAQMLKWIEPEMDALWQCVGFQCWGIYLDVHSTATKEAKTAFAAAAQVVRFSDANEADEANVLRRALEFVIKLCSLEALSAVAFGSDTSSMWMNLPTHLSHASMSVRAATARLLNVYLAFLAKSASSAGSTILALPLTSASGLTLDTSAALNLINASMRLLLTESDEAVINQVVQNVGFVGRLASATEPSALASEPALADGDGDEGDSDLEDDAEAEADGALETEAEAETDLFSHLVTRAAAVLRAEATPLHTKQAMLNLLNSLLKAPASASAASNSAPESGSGSAHTARLLPLLKPLLLPLHNITDATISRPSTHLHSRTSVDQNQDTLENNLMSSAHDLLTHLQATVGTTAFVKARQEVQRIVQGRREGRRAKRAIEKVSAPERYEEGKRRKRVGAKSKRRERNAGMAGRRRGW